MAVRALPLFQACRFDAISHFLCFISFSFVLFSLFDEHRPPTGRNGDTASPLLCLFHPVLVGALPDAPPGAPPGAAARLFASMAGRAGVWQRARQMPRDALAPLFRSLSFDHGRYFYLFFFLFVVRSLCRPNQPDWLRAFDFTRLRRQKSRRAASRSNASDRCF